MGGSCPAMSSVGGSGESRICRGRGRHHPSLALLVATPQNLSKRTTTTYEYTTRRYPLHRKGRSSVSTVYGRWVASTSFVADFAIKMVGKRAAKEYRQL